MKRIKLFFLMMAFAGMAHATVYYVSSAGNNTTGDSWTNAFTSPAAAIASATPVSGSEFWVKQGTYTSAATLSWETGQNFYGGFVGTETLRSQRSTDATLTILEGNNTNRVLNAPSMASATTWDGFTIQKGTAATGAGAFLQKNAILSNCIFQNNNAANATTPFIAAGGGIYIQGLVADADSIKVLNCTIKTNSVKTAITTAASGYSYCGGGGIYIKPGSIKAVVRGCTIDGNTSDGLGTANAIVCGGGIYIGDGTLDGCTIKNNIATNRIAASPYTLSTSGKCQGGGLMIMPQTTSNSITVKNCLVTGNYSEGSVGGGIAIDPLSGSGTLIAAPVSITRTFITNNWAYKNGGGIMTDGQNAASTSNYTFANCVIANNESTTSTGGGVFINNVAAYTGSVSFANCTVVNNKMIVATFGGAGIYYNNIKSDITNCAFWGNGGVTTFYNVKVKNTLTTNKLINCVFDSHFNELEVSPVATPADLTGKVIVELSNTGSTSGKFYANFTSPTNFIGKTVTAGDVTSLATADWSITAASACVNAGATLGAVTTDMIGTARPQGSAYDIGAYEAKPLQTLDATTAVTSIKATTATSGGNITSEGGATVTRGVCWSAATSTPTIEANAKTSNGTGLGTFTSNLSGLTPNSRYYVRAYATNLTGTIYGAAVNFYTDPLVTYTSGWPKVENATSSSFTAKANLNVAGISYYVVLPSGATAPTSAQVKAGHNAAGSAVTSGSITCTNAATEYTANISGLSVGTAYDLYFVAENAAGNNLQASPTMVSATTLQTYSISASAGTGGNITSGAGTYDFGTTATLVATANAGYRFINWTLNTSGGAEQSTLGSYPFTVSEAKTLVANFASVEVTVPTGNTTNASLLTNCANCDVTVSGANTVLTIDAPKTVKSITATTGGKLEVSQPLTVTGAMVIEAGAKLNLSNTLSVTGDLTFKADENGSFSAKIGTGVTLDPTSKVRYVKTMLDTKWYFLSFPCAININEIVQVEGGAFNLGADWYIKYYNGQTRATNRGGSNWVEIFDQNGTLSANQGYIIGLKTGVGTKHLSFVLNHSVVTNAENAARPVPVKVWDATAGTHAGWNLVGQPFISQFKGNKVTGATMVTIPDAVTGKTYTQPTMSNATFDPFAAYFIQAGSDDNLSFDIDGRSFVPAAVATDLSDRVELNVSTATGTDFTNLILDNNFSTSYEIGQDLEKWIGTGTTKPQLYSILGGVNYAFNALPMSSVVNLPIGFYTQTAGTSTISISNSSQAPSLSKLMLLDKTTGMTTDLLTSNYSFIADAGTDNTRFLITAQRVPTSVNIESNFQDEIGISVVNDKLLLLNLSPSTTIRICDAIGRMVVNKTINNTAFEIKLNAKGIYTVQLQNETKTSTRKVIL
ncbi:MAG: choice-of-anchor Q domain-containing protein [Paludibacter sp.]